MCLDGSIVLEGREKVRDQEFGIVNLYAPYSDIIHIWDNLKDRDILLGGNVLMGGDLNLRTLNSIEVRSHSQTHWQIIPLTFLRI
jgi:hypothetical protein